MNDFILVQFYTKKGTLHNVGQIELQLQDKTDFNIIILFFTKEFRFYSSEATDISFVDFKGIVKKLPQPKIVGGTLLAVSASALTFSY